MFEVNVFVKERTTTDGKKFKTYSTKNNKGDFYEVRFTLDCVNSHLIPRDKRVFTVVLDSKTVSSGKKNREHNGKIYTTNTLYVRGIVQVKDYIEPEFDCSDFDELPF